MNFRIPFLSLALVILASTTADAGPIEYLSFSTTDYDTARSSGNHSQISNGAVDLRFGRFSLSATGQSDDYYSLVDFGRIGGYSYFEEYDFVEDKLEVKFGFDITPNVNVYTGIKRKQFAGDWAQATYGEYFVFPISKSMKTRQIGAQIAFGALDLTAQIDTVMEGNFGPSYEDTQTKIGLRYAVTPQTKVLATYTYQRFTPTATTSGPKRSPQEVFVGVEHSSERYAGYALYRHAFDSDFSDFYRRPATEQLFLGVSYAVDDRLSLILRHAETLRDSSTLSGGSRAYSGSILTETGLAFDISPNTQLEFLYTDHHSGQFDSSVSFALVFDTGNGRRNTLDDMERLKAKARAESIFNTRANVHN